MANINILSKTLSTSTFISTIFSFFFLFSCNILATNATGPHHKIFTEKLTHLRFYFHDIVAGNNPTAIRVAEAPTTNASKVLFGLVTMIDDPLTETPEITSTLVGRAQGLYASASQEDTGLLMALNFVFTEGKYKGSTLSVFGRNAVFSKVRELPVIGGSGVFRFARGYALARTHAFNSKEAVVEYNVFVFHY